MSDVGALSARARSMHEDDKSVNVLYETLENVWDPESNPDGIVSLGVAENRLMHAELQAFINKRFSIGTHAFTYGDGALGSKRLRKAMAGFFNRRFNPAREVLPSHVGVVAGLTNANDMLAWLFGNPGDGFLLGRPHYGTFVMDFRARPGVETITVAFGDVDPLSLQAVPRYEETLLKAERAGTKIRALVLCTPHNPLGRCYPREVIIALMKLCHRHKIHLISDEIYALSVWHNKDSPNAPGFTSALSIDLNGIIDPRLVHVLWGLSKDFGANGLRVGAIVSQGNPEFHEALRTLSLFTCPSSASDHITCLLLEDHAFVDEYVRTNSARIAKNYNIATAFLQQHGIPYFKGSNAAFFLWVDLLAVIRRAKPNAGPAELELLKQRLVEHKVSINDGTTFGGEVSGFFRVVFTHPERYLMEGLRRIVAAVEETPGKPKARL